MRTTAWIRRLAFAEPPGAPAAAMAAAVLSVCFARTGPLWLSDALFGVAVVVWLALAAAFLAGLPANPVRWVARCAVPPSLNLAAATAVFGTRAALFGADGVAAGLLVAGTVLWLGLLPAVLRHWHTPTVGASFLVCVSTQALAVLAARLAARSGATWLLLPAGAAFVLGLALYAVVLRHVDLRQVVRGHGDHWVISGAVAISALAAAALGDGVGPPVGFPMHVVAVVLWWTAIAGSVPLAVGELLAPRLWYDIRRWSTAFPIGVLALAGLTISGAPQHDPLWITGVVLTWLDFALWLLLVVGALHATWRAHRRTPSADRTSLSRNGSARHRAGLSRLGAHSLRRHRPTA